jgi:hypothetical protein
MILLMVEWKGAALPTVNSSLEEKKLEKGDGSKRRQRTVPCLLETENRPLSP